MVELINTIRFITRDKKAKQWLRINSVLFLLFVLLFVVVIYLSIYQSAIEGNAKEYREYSRTAEKQVALLNYYDQYATRINAIHGSLSKKISQPALVREIADLAEKSQVKIAAQNYRAKSFKKGSKGFYLDLNVEGKYAGIKQFASKISQLHGVTYIERFKISRLETGQVHLAMQANVYQWGEQ